METASRLALMAILTRVGSPKEEKVAWNGSTGYLPIITVQDYDEEAALRRVRLDRSSGGAEAKGWWGLGRGDVAFAALLVMQCVSVVFVEGWIVWMGMYGEDFEVWVWLAEVASPGLLVLFSVSFSGVSLYGVKSRTRLADLGMQAAGLVMASFCGVVVCAGGVGSTGKGLVGVVIGVVLMWALFFVGFWVAVWRWYREDQRRMQEKRGKGVLRERERGYGTTSGGLALEDESWEGLVGELS
ncbi:hypothetical protein CGMCC3_g14237 [Colletotrichum fructicola]|uniref:Transmembrane protein n=1 Tax=Colletotrichum fructicola (strain Nara gc5) TaxID=1213859 RepID=A0A7J6IJA6_COLFN|nr:uncharacterized protein CGMCC3_g14237 [Colletotrichum fructicola]KAE9569595.1 hypothetical protein CGMCC3_g14237 [Colletotrichum fructicola]KAF4426938.1 hypothetical protein CFRS1_v003433 [Colletotrichum fructicola]KAF4476213.1 hypothetical protein CGGC5_v015447 [Colletotrichum fructicola Nara gc5]